jgi:hypothetical protein
MVFANFFLKSSWQVREFTPNTHVWAFVRRQRAKCGKAVAAQFVLARRHHMIQLCQILFAIPAPPILHKEKSRVHFGIGQCSSGSRFDHGSYTFHQLDLLDTRFSRVVFHLFLACHQLEHFIDNVYIGRVCIWFVFHFCIGIDLKVHELHFKYFAII